MLLMDSYQYSRIRAASPRTPGLENPWAVPAPSGQGNPGYPLFVCVIQVRAITNSQSELAKPMQGASVPESDAAQSG